MTNKVIKAELKAYLDQLAGLVPENDRALARELTHDVYGLFKELKKPERETVVVKVPVDDGPLRAELEKLKVENGQLKFRLSKCEDKEAALRKGHLMATGAFAGGYIIGRSVQCGEGHPDIAIFNSDALRAILRFTEADKEGITNTDLNTVCRGMAGYMIEYKIKTQGVGENDFDVESLAEEFYQGYWQALQKVHGPAVEVE